MVSEIVECYTHIDPGLNRLRIDRYHSPDTNQRFSALVKADKRDCFVIKDHVIIRVALKGLIVTIQRFT
jgi:hypothetical protein